VEYLERRFSAFVYQMVTYDGTTSHLSTKLSSVKLLGLDRNYTGVQRDDPSGSLPYG